MTRGGHPKVCCHGNGFKIQTNGSVYLVVIWICTIVDIGTGGRDIAYGTMKVYTLLKTAYINICPIGSSWMTHAGFLKTDLERSYFAYRQDMILERQI